MANNVTAAIAAYATKLNTSQDVALVMGLVGGSTIDDRSDAATRQALLAMLGGLAGFDDIVLGTTAPSNLTPQTFVQTTGTKTGVLAAGTYTGQTKRISQSIATGTPIGTITGTFKTLGGAAATTLGLGTTVGNIVDLLWDGAAWRATSALGGTGSSLA